MQNIILLILALTNPCVSSEFMTGKSDFRNNIYTVWKITEFSVIQILREIKVSESDLESQIRHFNKSKGSEF